MADWYLSGTGLELCNCYPGCGCNFRGYPNSADGSCHGLGANAIEEGNLDGLDLAGSKVVWVLAWPGAVHEGHGRAHAFVDCGSDEQFEALSRIWRGEEGGIAFEIYNSTLAQPTAVERASFSLTLDGTRSRLSGGGAVEATITPLLDPVTGEENVVRLVKPGGFDWREGDIAQVERMVVDVPGIAFEYDGTHAAVYRFEYAAN